MTAVSRGLDDLLAETAVRSGVLAVMDAADRLHNKLADAQFLASFAPAPTYYAKCVCGSVMEIRPSDHRTELDDDDREAIRDWEDAHSYCQDFGS